MDTKIYIKLGFKQDGIFFGWHEGSLYQLPYMHNGKYIGLRNLRLKQTKSGWQYYHVRRKKVGVEKLRAMLQSVVWEVSMPPELK